ncbi:MULTISPECIES: hypothetical protein [Actinosynnema]|uniref:hypothetical protein n=1 Tax=Actinosynnema TaxID=40566 RepID=UPI0020A5573C|nr:hypothetical protein [Actinosynnema pretiosum]
MRELVWNGIDGRSYDLVSLADDTVLAEESFDEYPTDAQIAKVLRHHGIDVELGVCAFCGDELLPATAHRHHNGWVGDCWDKRLRTNE